MKILFVCRGNIGRSQMAKEFYNSMTHSSNADACGTRVNELEGQRICDIEDDSVEDDIKAMKEEGLDISQNTRKQITSLLVENADHIIVMAEENTWSDYLKNNPRVIFWKIENPKGLGYEKTCEIRNRIKNKVEEFLQKGI